MKSLRSKKREISIFQKLNLYTTKAPYLLGEAFFIGGVVAPLISIFNQEKEAILGVFFLIPAFFFIRNKVKNYINGSKAIEYGEKTEAVLKEMESTGIQHNRRTVLAYTFEFKVKEKIYRYVFNSAYHKDLKLEMQFQLYYLEDNPNICVIPKLFSISL